MRGNRFVSQSISARVERFASVRVGRGLSLVRLLSIRRLAIR